MASDNIFSGLKVVDLASFIAGPAAAVILSDFGADVIKVEPPTGDLARSLAPVGDGRFSAMFQHANAGKRDRARAARRGAGSTHVKLLDRDKSNSD